MAQKTMNYNELKFENFLNQQNQQNQQNNNADINDIHIKNMLKKRLSQVFSELENYNLTRLKKIQILDSVLQELNMKRVDIMKSVRNNF